MNRGIARVILAAMAVAPLPACAVWNDLFAGDKGGPANVSDLVGSVEQVYVQSEVSKEKVRLASEALAKLTSPEFEGDAVSAHADLMVLIEQSEEQADNLNASIEAMKEAAEPVFDQWTRDLENFSDGDMRQRSLARLAATRKRFSNVVATVEPAHEHYVQVNKSLRDHALFLSHDLNPTSLSMLQDDVGDLSDEVARLDKDLDHCLVVARTYVDGAALPTKAGGEESGPAAVAVSGEDVVESEQDVVVEDEGK